MLLIKAARTHCKMLYELNRKHVNKQRSSQATPKCSQQWYKDNTGRNIPSHTGTSGMV